MTIHIYRGDVHRICPRCNYELPIEFFIIIGKVMFCRTCSEELKKGGCR